MRRFMDGTGGPYEWDDFTSVPLKKVPELEAIRYAAAMVPLPADADGLARLQRLLDRTVALAENSN